MPPLTLKKVHPDPAVFISASFSPRPYEGAVKMTCAPSAPVTLPAKPGGLAR